MNDLVFALGRPVEIEESMTCEFKEVKGHATLAIGKIVDEYAVAYLNEQGGSVYWGIRNRDRVVLGVRLDAKARDEVRQVIGQKIAAIAPPVSSACYGVPFHPVVADGSIVGDTFVVELSVRRPTSGGLFLTGSGEAYRKTLGGTKKLSGAELLTALLPQLQTRVQASVADRRPDVDISWMPSVARRAQVVRSLLRGARVLWVDDNPSNNLYERVTLASLGIQVDVALSTDEALYTVARAPYDLILSDMKRGPNPAAGIELLEELRRQTVFTPIVFYTAHVDHARPIPIGAFGLTNRPDELLHYAFDALERRHTLSG